MTHSEKLDLIIFKLKIRVAWNEWVRNGDKVFYHEWAEMTHLASGGEGAA